MRDTSIGDGVGCGCGGGGGGGCEMCFGVLRVGRG